MLLTPLFKAKSRADQNIFKAVAHSVHQVVKIINRNVDLLAGLIFSPNAMYLPKVIAFNAKDDSTAERYAVIADNMDLGGETTEEKIKLLIVYLRKMNDALDIPHCIGHYGADSYPVENGFVPEDVFLERLPEIAKNALDDACTGSNPRQIDQAEMEKLLKCCYYDTEVDF